MTNIDETGDFGISWWAWLGFNTPSTAKKRITRFVHELVGTNHDLTIKGTWPLMRCTLILRDVPESFARWVANDLERWI